MIRNHLPSRNVRVEHRDEMEVGSGECEDQFQMENNENIIRNDYGNLNEDSIYANRVHSLHRNKAFKSHDHLILGYEARVGGSGVRTLGRIRNTNQFHNVMEEHANRIVSKMGQDPALIEDSPASDDLRRTALRDLPQCLTLKRCVKQKLQKTVNKTAKRKPISCWKMMSYRISFFFLRLSYELKNLLYFFELWYNALKKIEGNFGSGVGSFFKFLRTIFFLNFFVSIISLVFIVVPEILHEYQRNESYTPVNFYWEDVFTGAGYFTTTPLYYGYYTNRTLSFFNLPYSMPHAYFFTMVVILLVFIAFFSISASVAYKQSFIETEGGLKNVFAQKIFCGWDFSIATKEAADLKSHAIYHELKELLFESQRMKIRKTFWQKLWIRTKQISINIALVGVGYLLWLFLDRAFNENFSSVVIAIFVNVMMVVIPIVLSWIVKIENYSSPRISLHMTLIRTFILGCILIGVLFTFLLRNPNQECWGTTLGQEMYRLILFDFILSVILSPLLDLCIYFVWRFFNKNCHFHYDISRNTMHIIYNQTLLWVGLMFSPLLPVMVTIKLFITFYVKELILLKCCKPSKKSWRATRTITWFLMITFIGLLLVIGLLGYILSAVPTTNCGPFKHYEYIYEIVTIDLLNLKNNSRIFKIVLLLTKPGFIALIFVGLCALIYYFKAKANAQRKLVAVYRKMLVWEARDKKFLLQNIAYITKGQWQYRLQDGRKPDPMLLSPFSMRNEIEASYTKSPRGSMTYENFASPSTSFMHRRSTDLGVEITKDIYENFKKIT